MLRGSQLRPRAADALPMSASAQPSGARHAGSEAEAGAHQIGPGTGIDTVTRARRVGTGFPEPGPASTSSAGTGFPDPVVGARLLLARAMLRGRSEEHTSELQSRENI